MKNNKCIYLHKKKGTDEVFYVGMGNKIRSRCEQGRSEWWWRIVNKYGYDIDIIFTNLSREEAIKKEIETIAFYGRKDKGLGSLVNHTDGGEGGCGMRFTDEMIERRRKHMNRLWKEEWYINMMSNRLKGIDNQKKWRESEAGKKKMKEYSEMFSGEGNPFHGRKHTQEVKDAISNANKGRFAGEKHPMYNKKKSEHQAAKTCVCMETGKKLGSKLCVAEYTGRNPVTVGGYMRSKNQRKRPEGFHWVYESEKEKHESAGRKYCFTKQIFI